jgi:hypothetical protein
MLCLKLVSSVCSINSKIQKSKRLLFAIKSTIARTVGPKPNITRQAYKTLVLPVLSYGCHLFANRLDTVTKQEALSKLNTLACLSLGSVPPGTPTMAMEILYNLRPLDLELERIALKTYYRINKSVPRHCLRRSRLNLAVQ